jgi:transcriptional regulator with XRE-family HTH domain
MLPLCGARELEVGADAGLGNGPELVYTPFRREQYLFSVAHCCTGECGMSRPKSTPEENSSPARFQFQAFAGLPQALARLILRDGRSRKDIAEAADLNASMLSGYCSGRRVPSLEHLDRLLTTLEAGIEDLTYEMRTIQYKAPNAQAAPLGVWPQLQTKEGAAAGALLSVLLEDMRGLLEAQAQAQATGAQPLPEPAPAPPAPRPEKRAAKTPRGKRD